MAFSFDVICGTKGDGCVEENFVKSFNEVVMTEDSSVKKEVGQLNCVLKVEFDLD